MGNGRLLSALVIHDTTLSGSFLKTEDIELFKLHEYRNTNTNKLHLQWWEDHLQYWKEIEINWEIKSNLADLLLIDCHFEDDKTAPQIGTDVDPRGLLHGIIFLAKLLGADPAHPMGFTIYSADITALSDDPYAQTFYGLLVSMSGELDEYKNVKLHEGGLIGWLVEHMKNRDHGGEVSDAWPRALEMYRKRFIESCDNGFIALDVESALNLQAKMKSIMKEKYYVQPDDLTLRWLSRSGEENVYMRSLFADCRINGNWIPDKVNAKKIQPWLDELVSMNWKTDFAQAKGLLDHVCETENPRNFEKSLIGINKKNGKSGKTSRLLRIRGLAMLMWVAKELAEKQNITVEFLNALFSLDSKLTSRAIKEGIGRNHPSMTPAIMIKMIKECDKWPFDPAAYLCIRKYLKEKGIDEQCWPNSCKNM